MVLMFSVGWFVVLLLLGRVGLWCGVLLWVSGVVFVWGFVYILLLLWIDVVKSYCLLFVDLKIWFVSEWCEIDCVVSLGFGELEVLMFDYFVGICYVLVNDLYVWLCCWLIV